MEEMYQGLGREVIRNQRLLALREQLGLSRTSMADMMHVTRSIYKHWEEHPDVNLKPESAVRIGRFFHHATNQVTALNADGIKLSELLPFHLVSTQLGVGQEVLLRRYREGAFAAEELGMLGLWVYREDLNYIAGVL